MEGLAASARKNLTPASRSLTTFDEVVLGFLRIGQAAYVLLDVLICSRYGVQENPKSFQFLNFFSHYRRIWYTENVE